MECAKGPNHKICYRKLISLNQTARKVLKLNFHGFEWGPSSGWTKLFDGLEITLSNFLKRFSKYTETGKCFMAGHSVIETFNLLLLPSWSHDPLKIAFAFEAVFYVPVQCSVLSGVQCVSCPASPGTACRLSATMHWINYESCGKWMKFSTVHKHSCIKITM